MAKQHRQPGSDADRNNCYVSAVVARSQADAEKYRELLYDHEIPAILEEDDESPAPRPQHSHTRRMTHGVSVLVPEPLLDEASEVIADREDLEEFEPDGDDVLEEEGEEDFGLHNLDEELDIPNPAIAVLEINRLFFRWPDRF